MPCLSKDATLASIKMGRVYLSGVLVNILAAEADGLAPEKICVRIGVTGQGSRPHYRIESPELEGVVALTGKSPYGGLFTVNLRRSALYKTFRGSNHGEIAELNDLESHERSWSIAAVSGSDIKLMTELYN